jgi:hypothetical protein
MGKPSNIYAHETIQTIKQINEDLKYILDTFKPKEQGEING